METLFLSSNLQSPFLFSSLSRWSPYTTVERKQELSHGTSLNPLSISTPVLWLFLSRSDSRTVLPFISRESLLPSVIFHYQLCLFSFLPAYLTSFPYPNLSHLFIHPLIRKQNNNHNSLPVTTWSLSSPSQVKLCRELPVFSISISASPNLNPHHSNFQSVLL